MSALTCTCISNFDLLLWLVFVVRACSIAVNLHRYALGKAATSILRVSMDSSIWIDTMAQW